MELHSPAAAKKLWNSIRLAFFMIRKGLISKRKLIMNMNLLMKRGKIKFMKKNLSSTLLAFHHHHHRRGYGDFSVQDYEFSCSNSPNPVFFHASGNKRRNFFPCLNVVVEEGDETLREKAVVVGDVPRIQYTPSRSPSPRFLYLAPGEAKSPLSVRISDFSEEDADGLVRREVDDEAEEFIRKFYEQLRVQGRTALIQYHEMEVQEMLARGH